MSRPESVSSSTASFGLLQRELEDLHALLLAAGEALVEVAGGELAAAPCVSSIAASTVLRKSFSEIGSSPRASRCAFMTMRRYFVTVTPGMATGYWKAMNRPARARSSGSASVMSSPLKRIWPSVTSRFGWPMIALASVDLPEPFGPISAWISPGADVQVDPLEDLLVAGGDVQVLDLELGHVVS